MADLDERLDRLITDQESMRKVLEMAKTILAQRDSAGPASATEPEPAATETVPESDLSSLLSTIMSQPASQSRQPENSPAGAPQQNPQGVSALAAVLPQLLQAMSGQSDLVKQERVTLLRAMRPYLKDTRLNSIDRALKMANMTKAAAAALHALGR